MTKILFKKLSWRNFTIPIRQGSDPSTRIRTWSFRSTNPQLTIQQKCQKTRPEWKHPVIWSDRKDDLLAADPSCRRIQPVIRWIPTLCVTLRRSLSLNQFWRRGKKRGLYLSIHLVVFPACLSFFLSVCKSVFLSVSLSVYLSVCLSVSLSVCLPAWMSVCLSVYLSVCLSILLFLCLTIYPRVFFLSLFLFSSSSWTLTSLPKFINSFYCIFYHFL